VDSQERLKARLDNVAAVEPILSALRSIALSSRLLALRRSESTARLVDELAELIDQLRRASPAATEPLWQRRPIKRRVLVVLGTERGLCGRLNELLAVLAERDMVQAESNGVDIQLVSLGRSAEKALRRLRRQPLQSMRLPARGLPPYELALQLSSGWLADYESSALDAVRVVHGVRRGLAGYAATATVLLPPPLEPSGEPEPLTLPPILEGDVATLARRALALWLCGSFYGIMLRSAVAEHTARYQLLEGAAQNAHALRDGLALELQQQRQEAITAEMQDLMAGAGLVGASPVAASGGGR